MRVHQANPHHCSALAKRLKREMQGVTPVTLSMAQNAVGRMMGFRNYHQMEASCGQVPPSAFDEDLTGTEVDARRAYQAKALADALKIQDDVARDVVARLRPSATKPSPVVTTEEWRRLLDEKPGVPGIDLDFERRQVVDREYVLHADVQVRADGTELPRRIHVRRHEITTTRHVVIKEFYAFLGAEGDEVGFADGYAVRVAIDHLEDVHVAADEVEDDIVETVAAMEKAGAYGDTDLLFEAAFGKGDFLVLRTVSRDHRRSAKGDGVGLVRGVIESLAAPRGRRGMSIETVAFEALPLQFGDKWDPTIRAGVGFRQAQERLRGWARAASANGVPLAVVDTGPRAAHHEGFAGPASRQRPNVGDPNEELADRAGSPPLLAAFYRTAARLLPGPEQDAFERVTALPREPVEVLENEPEGFSFERAHGLRGVSPHPAFWSNVPSELERVSVRYTGGTDRLRDSDGSRPAVNVTCGFLNGSVLEIPGAFLKGGYKFWDVLPSIAAPGGTINFENVNTTKMTVVDMHFVLMVNLLLLFDCGNDAKPLPEGQEFVLRRPKPHVAPVRPRAKQGTKAA